ncbi:MAG: methyltransferase domain-containing protein [Methanoregula sp.]|jgi:cobalt-precorrin-6B (C15)-methyltransferase|uniref:methyltransferase domain-containing protein n=1 Tax=Methanoregula sp. TaxID=2052170 RepID=UPI003D09A65F
MSEPKLAGGPTQDEVMAVALFKLGLIGKETVLEIGCGTGKVSVALAQRAGKVFSLDLRPEAVATARHTADRAGVNNIEFFCNDAVAFLGQDTVYDCAFVGGTRRLPKILPLLAKKVRGAIVINAVLVSTLAEAVSKLQELGIFVEAVQVQVARSHGIAGSIMFKPLDPVYVIVGRGAACS